MSGYRTEEQYVAKCPNCMMPVIENKPLRAKEKMTFVCKEEGCETEFVMKISQLTPYVEEPAATEKSYMNRQERDRYLFAHNMHIVIGSILEIPTLPANTRYAYQEALKLIERGTLEWMRGKDRRTLEQLLREADTYALNLVLRKDAWKQAKKAAEEDAKMRADIIDEVGRDPIYDLSLVTFQNICKHCDGSPAQSKEGCPIQSALQTLRIPPWGAVPECEYAYTGLLDDEVKAIKKNKNRELEAVGV